MVSFGSRSHEEFYALGYRKEVIEKTDDEFNQLAEEVLVSNAK